MKAIESKKDIEKRSRRNQWIVGGILIFVMLLSTFGYGMFSSSNKNNPNVEKVEYNGYEFTSQYGFWVTKIGNYDFMFKYNPTQVEKIESELVYLNGYSGKPLYIFSEDDAAVVEINKNLGEVVQRFQGACPENINCTKDWVVKDCSSNFIIIRESNESKIYQQENCAFIEGPKENLTQLADEFLFWITGIES
jgi:hypothetical protein